jgi:pterin-4a-carbinolamine dehydratase
MKIIAKTIIVRFGIVIFAGSTVNGFLASKTEVATMAACTSTSAGKCVPCEGLNELARLSFDEANKELTTMRLSGIWTIKELSNGVLSLNRQYTAKNFQAAMDSINAIGVIAERESHHPNIHLTNYRQVEVEIYTHSLSGLTKNDFILADHISSEVAIDYSPKWLRENPYAKETGREANSNA